MAQVKGQGIKYLLIHTVRAKCAKSRTEAAASGSHNKPENKLNKREELKKSPPLEGKLIKKRKRFKNKTSNKSYSRTLLTAMFNSSDDRNIDMNSCCVICSI